MAKVLLLGASGLVGSELLRLLRLDARVTSIIAPTRKPLPAMNKLNNPQGQNIGELLKTLQEPVDLVFCCLGTTRQQAGSQSAFRQVDYRLVLATGETGLRLGARHFLLVSAIGANPNSWLFYNRTKGEAERDLQAQGWPQLTFARPSMLAGKRAKPRLMETLSAPLFALLPDKWRLIKAKDVAQAMLDQAFAPPQDGVTILTSAQMQHARRT
ncbi:semialdehyde dehydrogenase, NAD binding domain protein [Yersinia rohdei]|uniref:Oxidoreductase n=1 Tax=Yersinia rohdei TaxID=29485 RepID=A0A0U1HRC5_YERRO|nr:NAD(P)H-binding protein [Yersinia rohdei]AJJ10015.1 semialdehyde dehydrogenase, NAD binding domain protein [Yersinia rohdei]MDN0092995.1 NAD(P)H-binding protein [Yersinia rohdei]CNE39620.1 oxidoreductase [Yersinia rohdei]CNJ01163.1 oxidoreductase [Yersinia rohdei]CQI89227.1 oxidoreductase [Yersinia rohdei]